jgi:hypothetical protein
MGRSGWALHLGTWPGGVHGIYGMLHELHNQLARSCDY